MKCGVNKELLDSCVGIHPTIAEDVIGLSYTKEDNPDAQKGGCWGWALATDKSCLTLVHHHYKSQACRIFNNAKKAETLECHQHPEVFAEPVIEVDECDDNHSVAQHNLERTTMILAKLWRPSAKSLLGTQIVGKIIVLLSFLPPTLTLALLSL